jgi:hypothetical protein
MASPLTSHEQVVRHEVIGGLLADEPTSEEDIAFGRAATVFLEDRAATVIAAGGGPGHDQTEGGAVGIFTSP